MQHDGYHWSIRPSGEAWRWDVRERHGGRLVLEGEAPSRAIAAALVIRAVARGVTDPVEARGVAV
ncbi:hypothetical protein [Brevundimonas sp.]|uniref:hypothetical protein n=1 Tax=Brevundimonas sp. TaxID=1871086 RepID=UPI002D493B37|nr:hypothetical protein [Brevundimonas sp.]HYC73981.1 hypothetical protein [Brevundimonas sp.]